MGCARFRPHEHLRRPADFRRVYDGRCSAGSPSLVVYAWANGLPFSRLGLSVSRKVGNAVVRNRTRRLLREAYRLSKANVPAGFDYVLVARGAALPPLASLLIEWPKLARQAAARAAARQTVPHDPTS